MQINKRDFFIFSNILSLYRLFLGLIFPLLWIKGVSKQILLFLIITAILSDTLDGNFARIFNKKTDLGKILDPLADKVFINMLFFLLYLNHYISLEFLFIILTRDIAIILGATFLFLKFRQIKFGPTYLGKACTVSQLLFLFLYFVYIFIKPFNEIFMRMMSVVVIFFTILSFLDYTFLFFSVFKKEPIK